MALPLSSSALATTLTLSKTQNTIPLFSFTKFPFFTNQTTPNSISNRPRSRKSFSLTIPRVAAPPTSVEPNQSNPETDRNETEEETGDESSSSKFNWRDHWYPVSLVEDLNPRFPTPFQLLGREIVIWFDSSKSQWVAFDDKCPHRLAPLSVVPRWYEHWTSNKVYDGDMIVLQGQEKIFLSATKDGGDINKQYTNITFTPTQADRFVLAFRNWLHRHGNDQPEWFGKFDQQPLPSTVLSKREMLDRFEQHTLKCSSCKGAYEAFKTWQKILIGATVLLCATAGIPPETNVRIVLAGLGVLSAGLAYAITELQKNFVFVDYVHAEID